MKEETKLKRKIKYQKYKILKKISLVIKEQLKKNMKWFRRDSINWKVMTLMNQEKKIFSNISKIKIIEIYVIKIYKK